MFVTACCRWVSDHPITCSIAFPNFSSFSEGTRKLYLLLSSNVKISGIPPTLLDTTGSPAASASRMARGKPSWREGIANPSNAARNFGISDTWPNKVISFAMPNFSARAVKLSWSLPFPAITKCPPRFPISFRAHAFKRISCPLTGASLPTAPHSQRCGGKLKNVRDSILTKSFLLKTLRSIPLWTTSILSAGNQ